MHMAVNKLNTTDTKDLTKEHRVIKIWEEFSQSLLDFIRRRVNDPDDAEDILQEVFLKIHTKIDTLEDDDRLVSWLYQITRNTIIDYYRTRRPSDELPETLSMDPEPVESAPTAQLAAGLREFMTCLPDKYRRAVVLTELDGLKQTELADRLGISISGAKSRVQRGREMLRQALLECCHFEFDRRGGVLDYTPRPDCCDTCSCNN
jgi:RNA polymerase sigma-70 factor (ECF subfamily)